jgi:protein-S-isoprenylcysteine O-methyltransferase Ste14
MASVRKGFPGYLDLREDQWMCTMTHLSPCFSSIAVSVPNTYTLLPLYFPVVSVSCNTTARNVRIPVNDLSSAAMAIYAFSRREFLTHDAGHLLEMMFGWKVNLHFGPFHILSYLFIFGGFTRLSCAWGLLYEAQRHHRLATTGLYARIRHPQYVAFVIIMFGFLLQWPTCITLVMFPILVWGYARLARSEERDMSAEFGSEYAQYRHRTPAFIPSFTKRRMAL